MRWGILGTGKIAAKFATALPFSRTGKLAAVASRAAETAERFARSHGETRAHSSYESLLEDPEVDAVYLALPHTLHAEWAIRAAEAGKHILCEKPLALNRWEAEAAISAARKADVFLLEGFMVRFHPLTRRWADLLREGVIGEPQLIEATFAFVTPRDKAARHFRHDLAGGSILDLGCYCMAAARLAAGAACGKAFLDPEEVSGTARIDTDARVDTAAVATLRFPGGLLAQLACGRSFAHDNALRIHGSHGRIEVPAPWIAKKEGGDSSLLVWRDGESRPRRLRVRCPKPVFALEADAVAEHLAARQTPEMGWADSLGNMDALDRWRTACGMLYDAERPKTARGPLRGGKSPKPLSGHRMRYGGIDGLDRPVSRLVLGADNQASFPHTSILFDDFFEQGGNTFDSAHIYDGGTPERLLGAWMRSRRIRDRVNVIVKGAHTPYCTPEFLLRQFRESLDRLDTDHADIYLMHRDNPQVPPGEFVDVLNRLQADGKVRVFGGSNWSLERIEQANRYAQQHSLHGMRALSNNLSLAEMIDPVWAGCVSVSDTASRVWLARERMALFAWSSQARGFFTGRSGPDLRTDRELVRCWYSETNFLRKERAQTLARERGVTAINIALAYVLCQPFPAFALIGPRSLEELHTSLPGLDVELSPDELHWLNLETESRPQ